MQENVIEKLEKKGFVRWTNYGKDRMYVHPNQLGLVCTYYKTGNIHTAIFRGTMISNSEARRIKGSKTFIDVPSGKVYSDNDLLREAVEEILKEVS